MSTSSIGRRYERLLVLAGPLSLLTLVLLFIAVATSSKQERVVASCYRIAAGVLEGRIAELGKGYEGKLPNKWNQDARMTYELQLGGILIREFLGTECFQPINDIAKTNYVQPPLIFVKHLRNEASRLSAGPLVFKGIELPEQASLNLLGTTIKVELMAFVQLLQVGLAPLLLLWLGSLYNTRYRESLLIASAKSISEVYPHVINIYPAVIKLNLRKRNYIAPYLPALISLVYALLRLALLMIFVAPTAIAYIWGVFLLNGNALWILFVTLTSPVAVFSLTLILAELLPWHYVKAFPSPVPSR